MRQKPLLRHERCGHAKFCQELGKNTGEGSLDRVSREGSLDRVNREDHPDRVTVEKPKMSLFQLCDT